MALFVAAFAMLNSLSYLVPHFDVLRNYEIGHDPKRLPVLLVLHQLFV